MDSYEAGIYLVDSYEWSIILGITLTLRINYGITLVEVDDETCPMPEKTCSTEHPTPYASVLKVTEMGSTPYLHEPHVERVPVEFESFT